MTEPPAARYPLTEGLTRAMAGKAEARAPATVSGAVDRYGWTSRDIAQRFGVSERTARRWRQYDRIPERRAGQWRDVTREAAAERQRRQIAARGLSGMAVTGIYRVSRSRYRAGARMPVRIMPGERIPGAAMRDVFGALDEGRADDAERLLNDALHAGYQLPGAAALEFEHVESLSYTVR